MVNIIVELSKYLMIILITMYTYLCFSIFGYQDPDRKKSMLRRQNVLMYMIHIIAFLVMYLETEDIKLLAFYLMQVVLFGATILLYTIIYPKVSRLVVNNLCMLLCIGLIMLTRLNYTNAVKQFVIAAGAIAISLAVPVIIRKFKKLAEWRKLYAAAGIVSLAVVVVLGQVSYGAKLGFTIAGINIQPSELVKIIFVFFVASSFKMSLE
ncbi:FtsW/RodA/SpoVE family cell cycle protein, partial [[Clostridium] hylemonae]